jgi:hypothetical protein
MLMGTSEHSRVGLMRAVWVTNELRRGQPSDWVFSSREGAELRQRLEARTPPTLMALATAGWQEFEPEVCDR